MAIEIIIPRLGWSMDEGTFGRWLKQDGDFVDEGEALFELEGDKAVQPVESFDAGVLRITPNGPAPGDVVRVGQRLGYLCRPGEPMPCDESLTNAASAAASTISSLPHHGDLELSRNWSPVRPECDLDACNDAGDARQPVATPSARRLARELGIDLRQIAAAESRLTVNEVRAVVSRETTAAPSLGIGRPISVSPRAARAAAKFGVKLAEVNNAGSSGRIRERDVLAVVAQQNTSPLISDTPHDGTNDAQTPLTSLRRTIAARMLAASQQTAAVTLTATADASSLVLLRRRKQADASASIPAPSYTDMLVKLAAVALERHPALLQQWTEQGLIRRKSLDIAVAVDTLQGLLAPTLRDVATLSLEKVSVGLTDLLARARARQLSPEEMHGGVFTITNLGRYRVDAFTPLLNMPQTAILGVGRIAPQPVALDGHVAVRDRVTLSLTFDHRVVDGATAAALLTTICELVENPLPFLVA